MSQHIEWANTGSPAALIDGVEAAEFQDAFGSKLDAGNVALFIGDGVVLEGTREDLAEWLRAALVLVGQHTFRPASSHAVVCVHGTPVWIGHECGDCEDAGVYLTSNPTHVERRCRDCEGDD